MNKKRYIPIVAIGALILSLIAVFPAFGAGTASFIQPDEIYDVNNGTLKDAKQDPQTYGMQGGQAGLFLEDDSLDTPIRRVLIPGLDNKAGANPNAGDTKVAGKAHTSAHDDVIYTTLLGLQMDDYIAVGGNAVRKVRKIAIATPTAAAGRLATATDDNTNHDWYLVLSTDTTDANNTSANSLSSDNINAILPDTNVFSGWTASPTGTDTYRFSVEAASDSELPAFLNAWSTDAPTLSEGNITITTPNAGRGIDTDSHMKDKTYTFMIKVEQRNTRGISPNQITTTVKTKMATISLHVQYAAMVTSDKPFATSTMAVTTTEPTNTPSDGAGAVGSEDVYEIDVFVSDANRTLKDDYGDASWDSNYGVYAMALSQSSARPNPFNTGDRRFTADYVLADSGIAPASTITTITLAHRLSASFDSRIGLKDAIAVGSNGSTRVEVINVDGEIIDYDGGSTDGYILGWFHEPNDTAASVSIRSQAYPTRKTVVMRETSGNSGVFALKIDLKPFGTDKGQIEMTDVSMTIPQLPVNERDVVTLSSSDSSATLTIETTDPTFTGLTPAHNSASSNSRPTVSAQVTDADSGLDEKNIDILFRVDEGNNGAWQEEVVNPKAHADSDGISGGYQVSVRLGDKDSTIAPEEDATIQWWVRATDKAGNVGFSDQKPTNKDGTPNLCTADKSTALEDLAGDGCQPYVILLDDTDPKLVRAETGRHWNSALDTGDSNDKTEYRVTKANKSSVLAVFNEYLDVTSVSANDFEVNGSTPTDASAYNVTVRMGTDTSVDNYATYDATDHVTDSSEKRGYVFLRLASDLKADADPKVELVGEVLDLAGNEQDTGNVDALDRIAPTLTVTIDEGSRPVTKDKVNLRITSDETVGKPTVTYSKVNPENNDKRAANDGTSAGVVVNFVSGTEYAVVLTSSGDDGLYTVHVEATDAGGGNKGVTGDNDTDVDVSSDTKAILFERDTKDPVLDVNPDEDEAQTTFSTDDMSGYIRIDFESEGAEYYTGDDQDTHAVVTIVSATLNGNDISDSLQSNEAGNVFLYRAPDGLTIGKHKLEVVATDDAGNKHATAQKATIEITERKPFSLKLNPGWNLVSIPGEPQDPAINAVIPADRTDISSVLAYDPTEPGQWLSATRGADGMFSGTLDNIIATRGYWIETTTFKPLPVMIPKQSPGLARLLPTIPVSKGWNMIPILDVDGNFKLEDGNDDRKDNDKLPTFSTLKSATVDDDKEARGYLDGLDADSTRAYTFNTLTNRWNLVSEVQLGKGYWVYVSKAGIIVP